MNDWQKNILAREEQIKNLLAGTRRIAVVGIKTEAQAFQPAFYVPQYMQNAGFEIIPVPVYFPEITEILGETVYRKLTDVPCEIDLVNIFRRPEDVPKHLEDILAKKPKAVWMQSGISNNFAANELAKNGILVVQNACLMVEHKYLLRK